jgi:YHS domain-containing protein
VAIEQTALIDPVLLPPAAPEVKKAEPEALVSSEPAAKSVVLLPSQTGLVGLSGYCPVSLKQGAEWKQGVASKRVVVEGVAYQLADVVDQDEFKAAPEKFIPAYHGLDSVMLRDGRIKPGVTGLKTTFGGRDYYFASKETLERFLQTPATYSSLRISLNFGTADGA